MLLDPDGATMSCYIGYDESSSDNRNNMIPTTVQWLDSPAYHISEITYELWHGCKQVSRGMGIGGLGDQDGYNIYSQIVMMEVFSIMSELRTNRIIPRDGLPSGSAGGIIQGKMRKSNNNRTGRKCIFTSECNSSSINNSNKI